MESTTMRFSLTFVIFLCQFLLSHSQDEPSPLKFLEKFGYLKPTKEGIPHGDKAMETAIRSYQLFMKLPPSGVLDEGTFEVMKKPRCGFPDVVEGENPFAPDQPDEGKTRNRARSKMENKFPIASSFTAPRYKWTGTKVTWKASSFSRKFSSGQQRRVFADAFKHWSDVTPLSIRETAGKADIEINFNRREHGDGARNAFDGEGGTLAHAFFPGASAISGDTHFDDEENWSMSKDGTNMLIVAAHEFGHALGLPHSQENNALMAPIYQYWEDFKLHSDDIRAIQSLYGRNTATVPTPTTRAPVTRSPTSAPAPRSTHCELRFGAITEGHDGKIYAFWKRNIYQLNQAGGVVAGFPKFVRLVYKKAPINTNAVTYSPWTRKTYFFKGNKVWRYSGFERDTGYPKVISNSPRSPAAAFVWRDGNIYLFKGKNFYVWNSRTEQIETGYPKLLKNYWRKVPGNPESAMMSRDGYTYFFKYSRYFKYDAYKRKVADGYPKEKAGPWLGCGQATPR